MRLARTAILIAALSCAAGASADERLYAVSVGLSADNGDGLGVIASGDVGITERTSASLSLGLARVDGVPQSVRSRFWQVGADHDFGPLGVFARWGQSGDPDDFDSDDGEFGLYASPGNWRFTGRYLRRDVDLVVRLINADPVIDRTVGTTADGYGFSARYTSEKRFRFSLGFKRFDFDRDLTLLNRIAVLDRLSPTTLSLSGSLLDASYTAGVEIPFDDSALTLSLARDRLAAEQRDVDSLSVGWLTPAGERSDLEVSLGVSKDDAPGGDSNVVYVSVLYLFYGLF